MARTFAAALAALACLAAPSYAAIPMVAASSRGWNSWYNFLGASNETATLAAAQYVKDNLLAYGYDTLTIDEGWSESGGAQVLDAYGRLSWNADMYPSGIPALAAQLRAMGLKLGLWIVRGVPRVAAEKRLPIFGTSYTADQAVRYDRNCSWNGLTFGASDGPAAVAYYSSLAVQMASWGVELVKIDCLWPNRYEGTGPQTYFDTDVLLETAAFGAAGMTVSLSPGISVTPYNGSVVAASRLASFYRIAEDVLDVYDSNPDGTFPQGVHQKLTKAVEYESLLGANGTWPDFDMLQLGNVVHSYSGSDSLPPTQTRLTHDEQVTQMTLFSATGTPLIMGGRLPLDDDAEGAWTLSLLTNAEVLALHNESETLSRRSFVPPERNPPGGGGGPELYGWSSTPLGLSPSSYVYASFYNAQPLASGSAPASATFAQLGLSSAAVCVRDLWEHTFEEPVGGPVPAAGGALGFTVGVNAHGARAFLITPVGDAACHDGLA